MLTLDDLAIKGSTYVLTLVFTDEDGNPVVPVSAVWSLSEIDGTIINNRENVTISSLASSIDITLSGADLNIATAASIVEEKLFHVGGTYNSSLGNGIPFKVHAKFSVLNVTTNTYDPALTEIAQELGTYLLALVFTDEEGDAVIPDTVTYTLTDKDGTVIDSVEDDSATPANPTNILLFDDNLEIINAACSFEYRLLKITAQYDGAAINNLPFKMTVGFNVENLKVNVGTGA